MKLGAVYTACVTANCARFVYLSKAKSSQNTEKSCAIKAADIFGSQEQDRCALVGTGCQILQ